MKQIAIILIMITVVNACTANIPISEQWHGKTFETATELSSFFNETKKGINDKDSAAIIENMCHMIWHSGEYIIKCKGQKEDINILPIEIDSIPLDNETVKNFTKGVNLEKFTDHYFMLRAMRRGDDFDTARDGLTVTVFFPIRAINNNDYNKLREIFSTKNNDLHTVYLEKMKFPFRNSGCTKELYALQPLIKQNVADSQLKNEILALYEQHATIMNGKPAPCPTLKDRAGKQYTFKNFSGKVLIIDVWATWCSSCLKKMPAYMELRDRYKDNPDIEFITVSIDRNKKKELWGKTIDRIGMNKMINLIIGTEEYSEFEEYYNISGIPRYIVIDRDGTIVSAYAPGPDNGLDQLAENTLNKQI